jgi:predicted Rossmann-fold nucleotide-binding protein
MTRVLVCGGRDFNDDERVFAVLSSYDHDYHFTRLIQGGAPGADSAAARWADIGGIVVMCFKPNWKKHSKAAGPIRNARMIEEGKPDLVIAFPGGRGTANMVAQARAAGIEVIEIGT